MVVGMRSRYSGSLGALAIVFALMAVLLLSAVNSVQGGSLSRRSVTSTKVMLPQTVCAMMQQAYLAQHPERHDLRVNGSDCTVSRTAVVTSIGPQGSRGISAYAAGIRASYSGCEGYWVSQNLSAWGYVQMGYTQVAIGACYDGSTVTRIWGPVCSITFWPPIMKGSTYTCGAYYGNGGLVAYGGFDGQLWEFGLGWCCDRYFWESYTVLPNGLWV